MTDATGRLQSGDATNRSGELANAGEVAKGRPQVIGLFADRLPINLLRMNARFADISAIFNAADIRDFTKLPDDLSERYPLLPG